jgi:hypothetical protein
VGSIKFFIDNHSLYGDGCDVESKAQRITSHLTHSSSMLLTFTITPHVIRPSLPPRPLNFRKTGLFLIDLEIRPAMLTIDAPQ